MKYSQNSIMFEKKIKPIIIFKDNYIEIIKLLFDDFTRLKIAWISKIKKKMFRNIKLTKNLQYFYQIPYLIANYFFSNENILLFSDENKVLYCENNINIIFNPIYSERELYSILHKILKLGFTQDLITKIILDALKEAYLLNQKIKEILIQYPDWFLSKDMTYESMLKYISKYKINNDIKSELLIGISKEDIENLRSMISKNHIIYKLLNSKFFSPCKQIIIFQNMEILFLIEELLNGVSNRNTRLYYVLDIHNEFWYKIDNLKKEFYIKKIKSVDDNEEDITTIELTDYEPIFL